MLIFLHNRRCSKSREALKILEESGKKYVLREYLKNPLDFEDLLELSEKLGRPAIEFCRTKEAEFGEQGLSQSSSDNDILKKMSIFPKLMERPIIFDDTSALVCRPPEKIKEFIS